MSYNVEFRLKQFAIGAALIGAGVAGAFVILNLATSAVVALINLN
jgi:hypothetical protein